MIKTMKRLLDRKKLTFLASLTFVASVSCANAQEAVQSKVLASNLKHPWGMAFLPDGDILLTERNFGSIRRFSFDTGLSNPIKNVPESVSVNQGGMLGLTIDPAFTENQTIYFCYVKKGNGGHSSNVAKAKLVNDSLADVKTIFTAKPLLNNGYHFGCRLGFDDDGNLFITLGDRNKYRKEAQSTDDHFGTIVRIHPDGSVPSDNPFVDGKAPEVYSYGHRNVQGLVVHPETRVLWAMEHGPRGGDEVNIIESGNNYGWPVITYGTEYSGRKITDITEKEGMEQPVLYWTPSIAPSGMAFYHGDKFPDWQGDLLVGSLKFRHLRRVKMNGDVPGEEIEYLKDLNERIRDVIIGPDGLIYVLTDEARGKLIQISPSS
ncbi:PQQ-dependent sugar dehydrogenase [Sessilibacter corallicola]|uniref:PQQ-dependent sugar dehydrogenase n=1 Tax=Sessilibacter corallicola TaxID=2904075 RepID=UPI001E5F3308|nr:PQQ-dependent sugar dehydrogenase [Sessilibacter corallicola]MCE2029607.1 PQQ-dependent sugar dehydrogenase [Sessilibacter corallicola]